MKIKSLIFASLLLPSLAIAQPSSGSLQYAEDSVHASADRGSMCLAVRKDTAASTSGTDGDYSALITDSTGKLHVNVGNAVAATQSGTWNVTNISGAVSLPTGASTAAKQPALGTAGAASADVITVQGIASMTALKVDGSAVTQPVSGTFWQATQPVSLASVPSHAVTNAGTFATQESGALLTSSQLIDDAVATTASAITTKGIAASGTDGTNARVLKTDTSGELQVDVLTMPTTAVTQSGTWTVQPGNTANTTPWLTQNTAVTSGGFTTYHLVSAATTNAANIKASAGQLYGWYIYNSNAAMRKVCLHNTAGTPTAGASIFFCLAVPGGAAANVFNDTGIPFSSGIGITTVTDLADSGATAVAANDLNINFFYK